MLLRVELSEWLATCFKIGHLPIAPGTWGSLAAVIGWWLWLQYLDPLVFIVLIITIFIIGVFATNIIIDHTGEKDPSRIVIDEVAGQWLGLLVLPDGALYIAAAFISFRLLDIIKPWPIRQLEKFPKGWGVMLDDMLAGILTLGLIQGYSRLVV
ncbi:MAG TPA: phosphatidylglycerophosphatase A [Candidatus Marinimicrobia bacterium]|nr:phosphatidylglycerophosphatase A [Candidatus Neomarinimicrobiota bacterium]HIM27047.1 phosphatidylglycerophosphatase A [Candidatus Neomarinimicrobiota bacterium]